MDGQLDGWMDGWLFGWVLEGGYKDGQMEIAGWMNGYVDSSWKEGCVDGEWFLG